MKNFLNKLFGKKPKEPLLTNEDKESVPDEKLFDKENLEVRLEEKKEFEKNIIDIVQPEEPVAPTLERQDEFTFDATDLSESKIHEIDWGKPISSSTMEIQDDRIFSFKNGKIKEIKPKKQAKKKDNRNPDDERKNWPGFNHFNL